MDERYDSYCATDPLFYDSLASASSRGNEFDAATRPLPDGWQREPSDDWLIVGPAGGSLPQQGWKVHLSACLDNAGKVLDIAWEYCVPRGLPFKFLRGPRMLLLRNAKYARRGSSGKFVTIYPRDEAELELVRLAGWAEPLPAGWAERGPGQRPRLRSRSGLGHAKPQFAVGHRRPRGVERQHRDVRLPGVPRDRRTGQRHRSHLRAGCDDGGEPGIPRREHRGVQFVPGQRHFGEEHDAGTGRPHHRRVHNGVGRHVVRDAQRLGNRHINRIRHVAPHAASSSSAYEAIGLPSAP